MAKLVSHSGDSPAEETELARQSEFVRGIISASPHTCYIFDRKQLRVLYSSNQIVRELGYSVAEIRDWGSSLLDRVLHPEDLARIPALLERWNAVDDDHVIETEYRMRRSDGEYRWFQARDKVFQRDTTGEVVQIIGWAEDVTDRRLAAEELQRRRAELFNVYRHGTLGEMATGVAHELSQPLSSVRNFVQAALNLLREPRDHEPEDDRRAEIINWLDHALVAADNAGEIVRRLRVFAKVAHSPRRAALPVLELVRQTLALLQFDLERRGTRTNVESAVTDSTAIFADRVQIQQVLVNLIHNACDAMEMRDPPDRLITITLYPRELAVEIQVRDHGVGLNADAERWFTPFVTTKPHGLGLGLSISRTIVEEHGGKLWAEPAPGQGAIFLFRIPMVAES